MCHVLCGASLTETIIGSRSDSKMQSQNRYWNCIIHIFMERRENVIVEGKYYLYKHWYSVASQVCKSPSLSYMKSIDRWSMKFLILSQNITTLRHTMIVNLYDGFYVFPVFGDTDISSRWRTRIDNAERHEMEFPHSSVFPSRYTLNPAPKGLTCREYISGPPCPPALFSLDQEGALRDQRE